MSTKVFGSGIRRREDPRLITGTATYTEDVVLPDMAYMALLRSPHAQARIKSIDSSDLRRSRYEILLLPNRDTQWLIALKPFVHHDANRLTRAFCSWRTFDHL
mgnify:CR=1 FL=1